MALAPAIRFSTLFLCAASSALAQPATFRGIGDAPPATSQDSYIANGGGVSSNGQFITGSGLGASGWVWSASSGFSSPTADIQIATGVSDNGLIFVGYLPVTPQAFGVLWDATANMAIPLGDLPGGANQCYPQDVSADGLVVVGESSSAASGSSSREAFRWTASTGLVALGDLPGGSYQSFAYAVSGDGSVVAGYSVSNNGQEAFRWDSVNGMIGLGDLPGGIFYSEAWGISGDGLAIVGRSISANGTEAMLWTQSGGMVGLGDLPGGTFVSWAWDVSNGGSVVVGEGRIGNAPGTDDRAVIWTATDGMRDLRTVLLAAGATGLDGWTLRRAKAVSDDGRTIVGEGVNPAGNREVFIATLPPPTPSCRGDFNNSGGVTVQDIFDYLTAYFSASPSADFNGVGGITVQDIFDFLAAWFMGCP